MNIQYIADEFGKVKKEGIEVDAVYLNPEDFYFIKNLETRNTIFQDKDGTCWLWGYQVFKTPNVDKGTVKLGVKYE